MKTSVNLACAAALLLSLEPATAMPVHTGLPSVEAGNLVRVSSRGEADARSTGYRRYHARRQFGHGYGYGNGGYHVNRYGFGNYVGGPTGGFAGYPAGSAGAEIYRQKQEWKCQDVPEEC